ncbi:MotA/TolQ/ExbB proton channel family protein [Desulfobacter curvatus]|uniref:MotA/TolQ/ExbB proton channel family protein n=1 Tax=Desulfobacter curvatus TaxID=2290 RepID=UPI00036A2915|nr:MotA/TolQ/ExbB proton channel family protein [Desulfobacter curvatus]
MKRTPQYTIIAAVLGVMLLFSQPAWAKDMREIRIETRKIEESMKQKAAAELSAAQKAASESRRQILADRSRLNRAIADLKQRITAVNVELKALKSENEGLATQESQLAAKLDDAQGTIQELSGVIRMNAKDIRSLLDDSFLTGVYHPDTQFLSTMTDSSVIPGMAQIKAMSDLLFDQIDQGGSVSLETGTIVNRKGKAQESKILIIGAFTGAYRTGGESGFLNYAHGEKKLYALSKLPTSAMQKQLTRYMEGKSDAVPMDISRGGALNQLIHDLSLMDQIPKGGPIVWPIIAILALGALITLERIFFILRRRISLETVCSKIETQAGDQNWNACAATCDQYSKNPVIRVIRSGVDSRDLPREDMENAVQEAILKEIPPMERFLSTMGMLAAIAPLLGLLGTVTGMIDTFHVITMHGTGDPRMMSGGISEALVTTMLGLSVAIPIMLSHTLLSRSVENSVGMMEEKAMALINIVQKFKGA